MLKPYYIILLLKWVNTDEQNNSNATFTKKAHVIIYKHGPIRESDDAFWSRDQSQRGRKQISIHRTDTIQCHPRLINCINHSKRQHCCRIIYNIAIFN